ncbi:hypothetical protein [Flaviaesturariibacter terrae]
MKKQLMNRKPLALFVAAIAAGTLSASAQTSTEPTAPEVSIIRVAPIDGRPMFQIRFDKPGTEALDISISDTDGEVLFSETVRDQHYDRYFLVDIARRDVQLVLQVEGRKRLPAQTFVIDTEEGAHTGIPVARR